VNLYGFWLHPEGWKALWVALRRSPRDAHARRNLLRILSSLIFIGVWIGWYAFFVHGAISDMGSSGIIVMVVGGLGGLLLTGIVAVKQHLEDRATERSNPAVARELKRALFREAVLLATLLERLGSEVEMEKELPPDITVITRRVLLDRLESHHLRDDLEPWLLDLLLAPDGHWTAKQKERTVGAWECFAVLNWALGLGELRDLTMEPGYQFKDLRTLTTIENPEKLPVLPSWDLRPARDAAFKFLNRCWAELLARNVVSGAASEDIARAMEMNSAIKEKGYTGDYLVGARTISELETPLLLILARRTSSRWELLSLLVPIAAGELPVNELRRFHARYFSASKTPQPDGAEEPA
jgi:hypothetical protein